MKLKVLFIIFNIVLFGLLFTIFIFPFFSYENSFFREIWRTNRIFGLIFFVLTIGIDILFFTNKKIIDNIETGNWYNLSGYLEQQIYVKKKQSLKNIKLLTETLLILGNFEEIEKLESFISTEKPKYLLKLAPKFAASKILSENYIGLKQFVSKFENNYGHNTEWMHFYSGFASYMCRDYIEAEKEFKKLIPISKNNLVKGLSAYFAYKLLNDYNGLTSEKNTADKEKNNTLVVYRQDAEHSSAIKKELQNKYTAAKWKKYIDFEKKEIYVMVLTKIIDDASIWIFSQN